MAGVIPQAFIDELLTRVNIIDVIGEYVQLKQRGRNYVACCPFHDEKTPSFSVDSNKQFYHCFGCGVGGNVVKFLMDYQHLGFVEAIEQLAERENLRVPRERGQADYAQKNKAAFQLLNNAADFYERQLYQTQDVIAYLKQRDIDKKTAVKYKLGYAPGGFDSMKSLSQKNYDESALLEVGLLAKKENAAYPRFRNRLMFPIRDLRGRVIAFGGRILSSDDKQGPKYLNSPETSLFQKRKTLYGVYELSKGQKIDSVLIVEGYMDVVSLSRHGIHNAVAMLGTAVTEEHIQQLFRICKNLVFCFDGDTAGRKAADAALRQSLPAFRDGFEIKFMLLPKGEDPDTLVKQEGMEKFAQRIEQSIPLSQFILDTVCENLDLALPEGVAAAVERARHLIGHLPKNAFRDLVLQSLAQKLNVSEKHLLVPPVKRQHYKDVGRKEARRTSVRRRHFSSVEVAAALLVNNPSLIKFALSEEQIPQSEETNSPWALLRNLIKQIKAERISTAGGLLSFYQGSEYETIINQLRQRQMPPDDEAEFKGCMQNIERNLSRRRQRQRIRRLTEKKRKTSLSAEEMQELRVLLAPKQFSEKQTR